MFGLLSNQDDPIDPTYGVPQSAVTQASLNSLGALGGLLMAAGQRMTPQQRAQYLSQMGNIPSAQDQIYKVAQSRLMAQKAQNDQEDRPLERAKTQAEINALTAKSSGGHWAAGSELPPDYKGPPVWMDANGPKAVGPAGTTINNAVNPILKGVGDQFEKSIENARSSLNTINSINTARDQLDANGGIVSGVGANAKLDFAKAAKLFGVDDPRIANTETFRAAIKPIVLQSVKGLGAGTSISNADREFVEKAVGGDITLDNKSIRRILDITDQAARANIGYHNNMADQMMKMSPELGNMAPMLKIQMPEAYKPKQQQQPGMAQPQGGPVRVMDRSQYDRLAPGAQYIAPDGSLRTKGGV